MPYTLICGGPGMFDPLDKWEAWLEELRAMPQDDEGVKLAIEEAERRIAALEADRR